MGETLQEPPRAVLSDDGQYRYRLVRPLQPGLSGGAGTVLFVMLNPSTADATRDDPTIRRCRRFAERGGGERLVVVNLFALRATDPTALLRHPEPVGAENYAAHLAAVREADSIVVAWGCPPPQLADRVRQLGRHFAGLVEQYKGAGWALLCLGTTASGFPRHPLYVRGDRDVEVWSP